jgi:hypothetical protein
MEGDKSHVRSAGAVSRQDAAAGWTFFRTPP